MEEKTSIVSTKPAPKPRTWTWVILILLCLLIIGSVSLYMGAKPDQQDAVSPPPAAVAPEASAPLTVPPSEIPSATAHQERLDQGESSVDLDSLNRDMTVELRQLRAVHGRVVDATLHVSSENIARFEWATSQDERLRVMKEMFEEDPARGVVVVLRSGAITRETTTDSEGSFTFFGVPDGPCELSVRGDSPAATAKKAMSPAEVQGGGGITLQLRNDWLTVSGHVRDAAGRPVAGAKVTGVHVFRSEDQRSWIRSSEEYSTVSDAGGCYEFEGVKPENAYKIAMSMGHYSGAASFEIRSAADDLRPGMVRVPLVSEDLVKIVLPLHDAVKRAILREGRALPEEIETDSLSSEGNRITNVDVVLDPA